MPSPPVYSATPSQSLQWLLRASIWVEEGERGQREESVRCGEMGKGVCVESRIRQCARECVRSVDRAGVI